MNDITINLILVTAMIIAAVYTVMVTRLMHSAVGLGLTSAILAILMFKLVCPIAAVFELSVCAGLISAIFISVTSLTQRLTPETFKERRRQRLKRFWFLPVIIVLAAVGLSVIRLPMTLSLPAQPAENNVNIVLWQLRHLDLLGQIVILLAGAFGVVIFFKERK